MRSGTVRRAVVERMLILYCALMSFVTADAQQSGERSPPQSPTSQQPTAQQIIIGERRIIQSKVLGEERPYWIYLPVSYAREPSASYPVLYLLDGTAHFHAVTGIVHHLSSSNAAVQRIPELIVVAIPNTKRTRDLTPTAVSEGLYSESSGGGDRFLGFLEQELFPHIESHFRARPERTLVGHSLGGLFTLHAFEKNPGLFQTYIAIDPSVWWDKEALVRRLATFDARKLKRATTVYVALAAVPLNEDDARDKDAIRHFSEGLRQMPPASLLRSRHEEFGSENHLSVPLVAVYNGLLFAFDGYRTAKK